ncbi:sigma-70 family RNA polymerase sigma factor [Aequorivita lipolytica]|uniref:Sigma-70 family RNA polymerase sigma factor n=1 Tax=Aequorivita lipolytica TaxID=153267 RepID=A0A5C6YM70_9FLAO|nr:sigma-70 family RNA polymerase sigma factor [Aequorivita lipolytica]TXD68118.1 sigma-70 family RNA polymerase sigma factor [Aequorivita lipolytica]SRX53539.1 ECF RNA polymerase sigma factor SigM [Aequorivita lipolytica]
METQKIWKQFNEELYFFILKKVKNEAATNDIFQNTFLKIHKNLHQLKEEEKMKAWVFQIARNEIANFFKQESLYITEVGKHTEALEEEYQNICCFDRFINNLPPIYREPIELVYLKGKKQHEVATILHVSHANVKARIRRAKAILKKNFNECCKYEFDKNGSLIGEPNCSQCTTTASEISN